MISHPLSGWQDSNLRPPAPKAGAMTGLRYTPSVIFICISSYLKGRYLSKASAKLIIKFNCTMSESEKLCILN